MTAGQINNLKVGNYISKISSSLRVEKPRKIVRIDEIGTLKDGKRYVEYMSELGKTTTIRGRSVEGENCTIRVTIKQLKGYENFMPYDDFVKL